MKSAKEGAWSTVPLGQLLVQSEETTEIQPDRRYRQVTVRLWGEGVVLRNEVSGTRISARKRRVVRTGQFILSRIDARNGAFGLVPESLDGAVVSNDFPAFSVNQQRLEPSFLAWMSKTESFVNLCRAASEGTTNRVRLKVDHFLEMPIPLPPLDEQRRIVARVEALAALIEEAQALRVKAREEGEAFFKAALAGMLSTESDAWTQEKVGNVIVSMDAGWSPQCETYPARGDEWGVLKTTAVQWCRFHPEENKKLPTTLEPRPELTVDAGDVLVTRAGPRKRVGVVATVPVSTPNLMMSDKLIRLRPNPTKIDPWFFQYVLASPLSQDYLFRRKTGLASAQENISQKILRSTPIAYPSLDEQRRIVAYLDDLQAHVDELAALQAATQAELDALLPSVLDRAFQGEL
jgi:type I restriction enzyme, S subunit